MNVEILSKTIGACAPKKPINPTNGLPYEQVAKAIIDATISLKQQIEAFDALEANISEKCKVPEAKPSKVIFFIFYF